MKKKSILTMVVSLALVGAVAVGSTLAYLTSTATKTNTFTVGNVTTTLTETNWNSSASHNLVPGTSFDKNPIVTVAAGSEECDVYMKVVIPAALQTLINSNRVSIDFQSDWSLVDAVKYPGVYKYKQTIAHNSSANTPLTALFTKVEASADATSDDMKTLTNNFNIIVSSFAIQHNVAGAAMSVDDQLAKANW